MHIRHPLLLAIAALFAVSCVFDISVDDGEDSTNSSSSKTNLSSSQLGSSSSMSSQDSLYEQIQRMRDSLARYQDSLRNARDSLNSISIDTMPTWGVPFTEATTPSPENPYGEPPDPVLASLGTLKLKDIINASDWETLFPHRAGVSTWCDGNDDFYSWQAFLTAAADFPAFAAEGPNEIRKREVAAFLAQVSHETTGGSGSYTTGSARYTWGLCFTEEIGYDDQSMAYRDENNTIWPPAPGKSYHGRGPIQLTWNYNYGAAGDDLGLPLLSQPELVLETGANAFRTALWFWMKEQHPKPSPHAAIIETWAPTSADKRNNRWPGFGVITNIINGGGECGDGSEGKPGPMDRMGFFARYAAFLGVGDGRNVDCSVQHDFSFQ